jgi:hypothetical protein
LFAITSEFFSVISNEILLSDAGRAEERILRKPQLRIALRCGGCLTGKASPLSSSDAVERPDTAEGSCRKRQPNDIFFHARLPVVSTGIKNQ